MVAPSQMPPVNATMMDATTDATTSTPNTPPDGMKISMARKITLSSNSKMDTNSVRWG